MQSGILILVKYNMAMKQRCLYERVLKDFKYPSVSEHNIK
jgi:hypothetical protein